MTYDVDLEEIQWKNTSGSSFENLVGVLLKNMFPNIKFHQTDYSHDGGKDFYAVGGEFGTDGIWVEAKNYNRHLELGKFSNTFIMADVGQINRIIIFSMSELTKGARINVARYAMYHKKAISVYAGDDIFRLLKEYRSKIIFEDYWDNPSQIDAILNNVSPPSYSNKLLVTYEHYRAKQFNFAYRRDYENHINDNQLDQIPINSIIAQEACIENPDLFQCRRVRLDRSAYESIDFDIYAKSHQDEEITIPPASTAIIVTYLRIVNCRPSLSLPTLRFSQQDIITMPASREVTCCWLGEVAYLGNAVAELNGLVDRLGSTKCFVVSGKSGVGKSRFLQETSAALYMRGYKIIDLDFRSTHQLSLNSVLQEILGNIFLLDTEKENRGTLVPQFSGLDHDHYALYEDFYRVIFDDAYQCAANIDRICAIFCELLKREKIALLLDNMQDLGTEVISFFEKLIRQILDNSSLQSNFVLCFNKDFLTMHKASTQLFDYLSQNARCHTVVLFDFSTTDAVLYLEECLDPGRRRNDLHIYYDKIIERFGTNPFVLKQFILYLKQRKIINFEGSLVYISNIDGLKAALEALPTGISQILHCRYRYLTQEAPNAGQSIAQIIWSILFFSGLPHHMTQILKFDSHNIRSLIEFGFVEYNICNELVFCHQLIEKYFCLYFMNVNHADYPRLVMASDRVFLRELLELITERSSSNYCVQEMLLRNELGRNNAETFKRAMEQLSIQAPHAIMLPLIINTVVEILETGIAIHPHIELHAAYELCVTCQDRYDGLIAAELIAPLVRYEQRTYPTKLKANDDLLSFFKHYVFLLPVQDKFVFLDWLIENTGKFYLPEAKRERFAGWLHNRYGKNLHSAHDFNSAETHIKKALEIALRSGDYASAAEAEIEYGNIFAYSDSEKTAMHWEKCVEYIDMCGDNSTYFQVYRCCYSVLARLLRHDTGDVAPELARMQELRQQTFLYQKLLIDDVYADHCLIKYALGQADETTLENLLFTLNVMKSDSYMYEQIFTLLATYKLLTVHRLLYKSGGAYDTHGEMVINLACELIDNGVFSGSHLDYAKMILWDLAEHCAKDKTAMSVIREKLPPAARELFLRRLRELEAGQTLSATTPLSDIGHNINLLLFNYVF